MSLDYGSRTCPACGHFLAEIDRLRVELAEVLAFNEELAKDRYDAETRLAAVIAELDRLAVEWPQDAEPSDLGLLRAAATGDAP